MFHDGGREEEIWSQKDEENTHWIFHFVFTEISF